MPSIQEFSISDLREWLSGGNGFRKDAVPITPHRALSQINNPRADGSDVVLLAAYDKGTVVAHLGILPDKIFSNGQEQKIGWLTAWWADRDRKYSGLGLVLLMRAFTLYQGRLGASGFSDDARKVYDATKKFIAISDFEGMTAFARCDMVRLFPRKLPIMTRLGMALRAVDAVTNQGVAVRQFLWKQRHKRTAGYRIEYVPAMDQETDEFIERSSSGELTKRRARELNWIARYPWVVCTPLAQPSQLQFASPAESYCNLTIKVYGSTEHLVAVIMLTIIDGHLIVPYCFHGDRASLVAQILCEHVAAVRLRRVTLYQPDLVDALLALRFPWVWRAKKRRTWVLSRECKVDASEKLLVQDGDGDCAFTL